MVSVVMVFLGLFLAGFCIVGLPRGVGQIVAGCALLVMSATVAAVPSYQDQPAPQPVSQPSGQTFTMRVTRP